MNVTVHALLPGREPPKLDCEIECPEYLSCEELIKKSVDQFRCEVPFSEDPKLYSLRMAEKDGQPDMDFPKINGSQKIGQIGFKNFTLMFEDKALQALQK